MAQLNNIKMFIDISRDLRSLGRNKSFFTDFSLGKKVLNDYLEGMRKRIINYSQFDPNADINSKTIQEVYPREIGKLLSEKSMRKLREWVMELKKRYKKDNSKEIVFLALVAIIWHMVLEELILAVLNVCENDADMLKKIDYNSMGLSKGNLKYFTLLNDIIRNDVDTFLNRNSVTEDDLEEMEKYIRRLVNIKIGMKYV